MSSRLSHGLQTCLEPRVPETRIIRLILAPSKTSNVAVERLNRGVNKSNVNGWNFIEALSNTSLMLKEHKYQEEHAYIHLSDKSLEMCTESLGSETGSNIADGDKNDTAFTYTAAAVAAKTELKNINGCKLKSRKTRVNQKRNFPPPLTSMTGASGFVRVKPCREEGKLVLKAVSMASADPVFEAERGNGRLTLRVARSQPETGAEDMKQAEQLDD